MFHPAAPPGSACLPLGRGFQPFKALKLWLFVPSSHTVHRHPVAPTQAGVTLIAQKTGYFADVFMGLFQNSGPRLTPRWKTVI